MKKTALLLLLLLLLVPAAQAASPAVKTTSEEARRIGWPSWSGPYHNFRGTPCGHELVDQLHQARLVWVSEEVTPVAKAFASVSGSNAGGRHREGQEVKHQRGLYPGGGASPVVVDGHVLLSYYVPDKDSPWVTDPGKTRWKNRPSLATDVVLCVDAATGKTLWKREFPGGPFFIGAKSAGNSGLSPCVFDGKVYSFCTGHMLRALDVETGQLVWETPLHTGGKRKVDLHQKSMAFRQEILRRRESGEANYHEVPGWTQDGSPHFGSRSGQNLICIGGVVLVEGLLAFDAQKGKLLWQKQIRGYPSRWCSEKGDLILMASNAPQDNKIICIEPKTGKEIWSTPFGGAPNDTMLTVEDNLAVGRAPGVAFTDQRGEDTGHGLLAAWRLGPQGPTLLWRHDEKTGFKIPSKCQPVLIDGLVWCGVPDPPKPAYPVACFDAQTGKHLGTINVPSGRRPGDIMQLEDRLLILGDSAHIKNTAFWAWAGGQRFDVAGEPWVNPHPPTTPLYATITWPYVDGHLYVRGADGIYCYDLRKNHAVR